MGPAWAHAALCFLSSRALPTCSIRMSDCFPGATHLTISARKVGTPRPESPSPVLPSAAGPFHQSFALSSRRNAPQPRGELATFTLLFKLARRHHQQITLSCLAARPDSARISLLTWSWTLGRKPGRSPKHVVCHVQHKKECPPEFFHSLGADNAAASIPKSTGL